MLNIPNDRAEFAAVAWPQGWAVVHISILCRILTQECLQYLSSSDGEGLGASGGHSDLAPQRLCLCRLAVQPTWTVRQSRSNLAICPDGPVRPVCRAVSL